MNVVSPRALLALTLVAVTSTGAQDKGRQTASDPELGILQQQNALLEERIKSLTLRQQFEKLDHPDPGSAQNEILDQRIRMMTEERGLLKPPLQQSVPRTTEVQDHTTIEGARIAYTALTGLAPAIAKDLACSGKNVVLYGTTLSDSLVSLKLFMDQSEALRSRMKALLDTPGPTAPPATEPTSAAPASGPAAASVATSAPAATSVPAASAGPVLQAVTDLISLLNTSQRLPHDDVSGDEGGAIAAVMNAAAAQGCIVYWPDQYAVNPFKVDSQLTALLQNLADVNDSAGSAGKTAGLQQHIRTMRSELRRADAMVDSIAEKIEKEQSKLSDASTHLEAVKVRVDWISQHIRDDKDAALQSKLNKTFERSWEEFESAVKKQLASKLPQTMEEQGRLSEMSKRVDVLKTQTELLSRYVRDEKDLMLQDKVKRSLASAWEELDASVKALQAITVSVPRAIEADQKEQKRWQRYTQELKEFIGIITAASNAYSAFRGALLDSRSGASALTRMLRAEAFRDLAFDEKLQERQGSTIVQIRLQKLTGSVSRTRPDVKESYSGGVVLSFFQYEPNGKLKNSGVHTAYTGFQNQP